MLVNITDVLGMTTKKEPAFWDSLQVNFREGEIVSY